MLDSKICQRVIIRLLIILRLDSNIEWGMLNNTFIQHHGNIKEIVQFVKNQAVP